VDFKKNDVVVIKQGVMDAGQELLVLGEPVFKEQWWVPVADPREEDPTFFKATHLVLKEPRNYFLLIKESRNSLCKKYVIATERNADYFDNLTLDSLLSDLCDYDGAGHQSSEVKVESLETGPVLGKKAFSFYGDTVFELG